MAKRNDLVAESAYSSTVRKIYNVDSFGKSANLEKEITFVSSTTGAVGSHVLATVTGVVALSIFAVNTGGSTLSGSTATLEVGTTKLTSSLLPLVTATTFADKEIWHDGTLDADVELTSVLKDNIVTNNITYDIKTAPITSGTITFLIRWSPISSDGNVVLI